MTQGRTRKQDRKAGMNQAEFAASIKLRGAVNHVSQAEVSRWESGKRRPDVKTLVAIVHQFGVDPGWLLVGRGQIHPTAAKESNVKTRKVTAREFYPDGTLKREEYET